MIQIYRIYLVSSLEDCTQIRKQNKTKKQKQLRKLLRIIVYSVCYLRVYITASKHYWFCWHHVLMNVEK